MGRRSKIRSGLKKINMSASSFIAASLLFVLAIIISFLVKEIPRSSVEVKETIHRTANI